MEQPSVLSDPFSFLLPLHFALELSHFFARWKKVGTGRPLSEFHPPIKWPFAVISGNATFCFDIHIRFICCACPCLEIWTTNKRGSSFIYGLDTLHLSHVWAWDNGLHFCIAKALESGWKNILYRVQTQRLTTPVDISAILQVHVWGLLISPAPARPSFVACGFASCVFSECRAGSKFPQQQVVGRRRMDGWLEERVFA